jgi:hypothetical protein
MASEVLVALKILRKLIKLGDTKKIKATLDGQPLDKTDVDFHLVTYVLEAWRTEPQEYFRCEFPYFHPDRPDLKVNGQEKFQEKADVDLTAKERGVTLELDYSDDAAGSQPHKLVFKFPFV